MNLVAACMKQGMRGMTKAGTAIKRETTQNQPDVQLNNVQVRNTETASWTGRQFKLLLLCLLSVGTMYWTQQREVQFRMRLEWDKTPG